MNKRLWRLGLVGGVVLVVLVAGTLLGASLITQAAAPSANLTRYTVSSTTGNSAIGITVDQNGDAWFGLGSGAIGKINHATGALKVYYLANANAGVGTIKVDGDGLVWFTAFNIPAIGRLDPVTGKETDFVLPSPTLGPDFLEIDSAGNKWFNEVDFSDATGGKVGRLGPGGEIVEWAVPTTAAELEEIGLDGNGNLWFAEQGANKIGRLNPHTNTITEFTSPTPNSRPAGILVAPDNTVWFSEHAADKIAHLFPNRAHGVTTTVTPVVSHQHPGSTNQPGVPGAPTNPKTFHEPGQTVQTTTTSTDGFVEYSLPASGSTSNTEDMRFDKNGNIFFENDATAQIGELVLHGKDQPFINLWSIPNGQGFYNIEFAPNGTTLWISDLNGGAVYKFTLGA